MDPNSSAQKDNGSIGSQLTATRVEDPLNPGATSTPSCDFTATVEDDRATVKNVSWWKLLNKKYKWEIIDSSLGILWKFSKI